MSKKQTLKVAVTKVIEVTLDLEKLDDEFWHDFNTSIDDRGGPDIDYLAEHIAWNYVQGDQDFVEGVGPLKDMNITADCIETECEVQ